MRITVFNASERRRYERSLVDAKADADLAVQAEHIALAEPIEADSGRIGQLVSNLLGNALTHGAADQPVRLSATTRDGTFELWVANGGAPIPAETMAHLFQPFFRGAVRPSQQGLGLGLHIAAEIARAHGGAIAVSSDAAETRFTFRMPCTQGG